VRNRGAISAQPRRHRRRGAGTVGAGNHDILDDRDRPAEPQRRRIRHARHGLGKRRRWAHIAGMSSMLVFDRATVRRHRDRAAATVGSVADILTDAAERLLDRLDDTNRRFEDALDIGGRGVVAPMLLARGMRVVCCDLSAKMAARMAQAGRVTAARPMLAPMLPAAVAPITFAPTIPSLAADEEFLPFAPASFDLITANLSLHWVNDLPGALIQIRQALRPGGLFLASLPALGTLAELRQALTEAEAELTGGAAPRVSPFPELRDCAHLLQRAGFTLPVADQDQIKLLYADPFALLRDLRAAGETSALRQRSRTAPHRFLLPAALGRMPTEGDRIPVTLRLAMMTGWAPDAADNPPVKPL